MLGCFAINLKTNFFAYTVHTYKKSEEDEKRRNRKMINVENANEINGKNLKKI